MAAGPTKHGTVPSNRPLSGPGGVSGPHVDPALAKALDYLVQGRGGNHGAGHELDRLARGPAPLAATKASTWSIVSADIESVRVGPAFTWQGRQAWLHT